MATLLWHVPAPDRQPGAEIVFSEMSSLDMRAFAKRIARLCGVPVHETGAHSFRIGGATDMADGGIPPTLIQARGRWASDIFHIYTRDTVEQQFQAADAVLSARGEAIESVFADFVQPATR